MRHTRVNSTLLAAFASALLLMSCGASHSVQDEGISKDIGFGYEKLRGKALLIAGISSQRVTLSMEERVRLGGEMSNMLIEKLKGAHDIRITGTRMLVSRMGLPAYADVMSACDAGEMLTADGMRAIAGADAGDAYILLAYIVNENVTDYSHDRVIQSGKKEQVETEYEKQYFLSVDFQLYDVKHEKMVWSNVVYNEAERTESRTTETGCMESCMSSLIDAILFGPPAEISREEVLDEIVERCVENLTRTRGS